MRILVHDYAGHAFTVQLSRELASQGHEVMHCFSVNLPSTPQGVNQKLPGDPPNFYSQPIDLGRMMDRQNYKQLFFKDDPQHAAIVCEVIEAFHPDVVLSGNASPVVNSRLIQACWRENIKFVNWVQDLFGHSAGAILPAKLGKLVGGTAAKYVDKLEQSTFAKADHVVVIAEAFRPFIRNPKGDVTVIENWAPLEEMPLTNRVNSWGKKHGLDKTRNFIYSGTIGMKHNPELLVKVAEAFRAEADVRTVVISQGRGMDYLKQRKEELGLENLVLLPFQPFEDLPKVMGSADVLVAILEPDAGVFSVPSKVLSYLCAGRGVLLAVPPENLAARIVADNGAGRVVAPTDADGFVSAAREMMSDADGLKTMGSKARAYAERTFDIQAIGERFVDIFKNIAKR
ncbi:MAG: glycosyltransferase family 4 protein [Fimbriimonadaceae bacterium]|nr:MAG: glycosyltransferase family 4 protein [Fimbriimonadaceae bacterium]